MGDLQRIGTASLDWMGAESGELADIRLPEERRRKLKMLARVMGEEHTVDELIYLAGALENQANEKRGKDS